MVCTQTERGLESKFHRAQPTELAMYLYVPLSTTKVQFSFRPSFWDGSNRRLTEMSDCLIIIKSSIIHFKKDRALANRRLKVNLESVLEAWMTLSHVLLSSTYGHDCEPLTPPIDNIRSCYRRLTVTIENHCPLLSSTYVLAIVDLLTSYRRLTRSICRLPTVSYHRLMVGLLSTYCWHHIFNDDLNKRDKSHL